MYSNYLKKQIKNDQQHFKFLLDEMTNYKQNKTQFLIQQLKYYNFEISCYCDNTNKSNISTTNNSGGKTTKNPQKKQTIFQIFSNIYIF